MEETQAMPGRGNGNIAQLTKPLSPDLEQLTQDWRAFVADCETMLKNATTLSGSGAAIARAQLSEKMAAAKIKFGAMGMTASDRAATARRSRRWRRRGSAEPICACGYPPAEESTTPRASAGSGAPFLTDVTKLRERARQHIDSGAVTANYGAEPRVVTEVLNAALAPE